MSAWLAAHLAPLMFAALALALFSGVPVVFGLAGCGLAFAWLGVQLDVMPVALISALPLRVFGIMASELLLAIPFFTFMGLVLDCTGWPKRCWTPPANCRAACAVALRCR